MSELSGSGLKWELSLLGPGVHFLPVWEDFTAWTMKILTICGFFIIFSLVRSTVTVKHSWTSGIIIPFLERVTIKPQQSVSCFLTSNYYTYYQQS